MDFFFPHTDVKKYMSLQKYPCMCEEGLNPLLFLLFDRVLLVKHQLCDNVLQQQALKCVELHFYFYNRTLNATRIKQI